MTKSLKSKFPEVQVEETKWFAMFNSIECLVFKFPVVSFYDNIIILLKSMLPSSYKLTRKNFETEFELDNDLAFFNAHYPFPNDL